MGEPNILVSDLIIESTVSSLERMVNPLEQIQEVLRAKKGDKDAFVRLIRLSEQSMYQASKAILHSDNDCADAMQEAILKAYRSIRTLREPAYFKTWLIRILIHECNRLLQHKQKIIPFKELHIAIERDAGYTSIELKEAVRSLEPDLRIVIHLYYFSDWPIKDVSKALDLPEGTVKSRLYRARDLLHENLQGGMRGADLS